MGEAVDEGGDSLATVTLSLPEQKVVKALTEQTSLPHGGVLVKDKDGLSSLGVIFHELKILLVDAKETTPKVNDGLETLWEILSILVRSADTRTEGTPFHLIHALVSLLCATVVLTEALRRFPEQAVERDENGRKPLLIATSQVEDMEPQAICELARCNQGMTDNEGRLPIDFAAEKGVYNEELFEALVMAEPRAVDTRNIKNGQHPFLTAALATGENTNLSSVYHLLRTKPHVIAYFMDQNY